MKVVGLASKVEEILKITQLYQVFPEFPDEPPHLRAFPRPPAAGIRGTSPLGPKRRRQSAAELTACHCNPFWKKWAKKERSS